MYSSNFNPVADKQKLVDYYKGKSKSQLPTPCFIVNKKVVKENCDKMLQNVKDMKTGFRAHVKTHKTLECTLLQLGIDEKNKEPKTKKIIVSTLMEAWNLLPLVEKGFINDILFSLPVIESRLLELYNLSQKFKNLKLRIMLDNFEQLDVLTNFNLSNKITTKWSIFVKVNMGTNRAGLKIDDSNIDEIINKVLKDSKYSENISLYGFYCHAGHAYGSKSTKDAQKYLIDEIEFGNKACEKAIKIDSTLNLILSVGSTPTAHVSNNEITEKIEKLGKLYGKLELHAGNYPFCDLQQVATKCVNIENVACKLLADVISIYPNRGSKLPGEELVNAGVIALSRESSPIEGFGKVVSPKGYGNWVIGRLSQEHGILVPESSEESHQTKLFPIGTRIEIVPQHSCITAASHPFYFIFEDEKNDKVVDVWVPYRGW